MFNPFCGDINGHNIYDESSIDQDDYYIPEQNNPHIDMNKPEKEEAPPKVLDGEIKRETEKAILFKFGESENWMPKSQVVIKKKKDGCSVEIPAWLWTKMNEISDE